MCSADIFTSKVAKCCFETSSELHEEKVRAKCTRYTSDSVVITYDIRVSR